MSLIHVYIQVLGMSCLFFSLNMFGLKAVPLWSSKPCTIMIDPAGDARQTGRLIDGVYERSIALECALALQDELEHMLPRVTVLVTRTAGEVIEPCQNAQFANRCGVDLFIRLQFFHELTVQRHSLYLYHFSWGNELPLRMYDAMFIPYHKAHLVTTVVTKSYAEQLCVSLNKASTHLCQGVFALPCKPLSGIMAPALCLEMGLLSKDSWRDYVQPIVSAVRELMLPV